jgi:hypothetical protein
MFRFKPASWDELKARAAAHAATSPAQRMAEQPRPRPLNVRHVLDLGQLLYFQWRGRCYGVPPLPWRAGAALLDAFLEAQSFGVVIDRESAGPYYAALERMARIMWRNSRPTGLVPRVFHRLRLTPNRFQRASEAELVELALFFLGRRTKTSATLRVVDPTPARATI